MIGQATKPFGTIPRLGAMLVATAMVAAAGCGDGVERNTVQVPDRGGMSPGGSEKAPAKTDKGKGAVPDTKVMTPGGKKM